jgi:hypothetical protein
MTRRAWSFSALLALVFAAAAVPAFADEGMWTFDNLPVRQLKERYDFTPTPEWVEHVRHSSVRLNDGGSGGFVSPEGLLLTNHHVALGQLQKVSNEKKDFVRDGFFARTRAEEMKCPDLEVNLLVSTEEVTARVNGAIDAKAPIEVQNKQRKAEMARIEKESTDKTGLRSDVVKFYEGGEYWLYRYKKYTDIRLVMAPERQAAFYGGDPDNFTYPRYDLDFAFFRAYEDGRPAHTKDYFRFNPQGPAEGDLVFVTGNPGSTDRLTTVKQLEYQRDYLLPAILEKLERRLDALRQYSARAPEQVRRAQPSIFGNENSVKAFIGELSGIKDPGMMAKKVSDERDLRARVAKDPALASTLGPAWDHIALAQREAIRRFKDRTYHSSYVSDLARLAHTIVRYVAEVEKPNETRFEEYRDSALESMRFELFSPAPIYPDLEEVVLADALKESFEKLGPNDPYVKAALEGRSPAEEAHELVSQTKLADVAERKRLIEGGVKAVAASTDPFIAWARRIDPIYRELRRWGEDHIESVEAIEGGRIAKARFAAYGRSTYPDATFTPRLSFGKVAGYDQGTSRVPWRTTLYGLYDRADSFGGREPFDLSPMEAKRRGALALSTPVDFVTTNDIIGGNSGSPVLNRKGEYVGLVFDSNIQGLAGNFAYSEVQARTVAVHSAGILEAIKNLYQMQGLANELLGHAPAVKLTRRVATR